jgi:hypothetical protein
LDHYAEAAVTFKAASSTVETLTSFSFINCSRSNSSSSLESSLPTPEM